MNFTATDPKTGETFQGKSKIAKTHAVISDTYGGGRGATFHKDCKSAEASTKYKTNWVIVEVN